MYKKELIELCREMNENLKEYSSTKVIQNSQNLSVGVLNKFSRMKNINDDEGYVKFRQNTLINIANALDNLNKQEERQDGKGSYEEKIRTIVEKLISLGQEAGFNELLSIGFGNTQASKIVTKGTSGVYVMDTLLKLEKLENIEDE